MSNTRFAHRTALVTGGGSGLGRATALGLAAEGAKVVVSGRTAGTLDETVRLIQEQGGQALAVRADTTRPTDVEALVRRTVRHFGSLDIAVNNAGILRGFGPVADVTWPDWQALLDTNLTGVWLSMKHEIIHMRAHGGGAIVNISANLGAHCRAADLTAYSTTKAAVSALTRGAALDHIRDGIRINAVSPGASATAMSLRPGETEAEREIRMRTASPLGRVAGTDEVTAAVLYLASDAAAAAVGTDLVIDGGASA